MVSLVQPQHQKRFAKKAADYQASCAGAAPHISQQLVKTSILGTAFDRPRRGFAQSVQSGLAPSKKRTHGVHQTLALGDQELDGLGLRGRVA
jgi:hypothetical protein